MVDLVDEKTGLGKIRELCQELAKHGVVYCHWKSNAALSRSASGENDLDLLVSRADIQRFTEILYRLDFKQALDCSGSRMPGVLDYYGYDREADRLVHVHAHYQLILGHDATKNYHIPVEDPYLDSSSSNGIFKVPSAEFELIILVLRLMLKHNTWDTLLLRQGKLSSSEKIELDYLLERSCASKLDGILKEHLPFISPDLLKACLRVLSSNCSILERVQVGQKVLDCLDAYGRRPKIVDAVLKLWRRVAWPVEQRIFKKEARKQMARGGLIVAVVGGDGAGKTTVVEEVIKWLADDFAVKRFHMGKPAWSVLTIFVRGLLKIGRSLGFYPFMKAEILYTHAADLLAFPGYPWLIREICTARDRYITYRKARRFATNGGFVILDRFPLQQIQFMDGPQVARMSGKIPGTKLLRFLIRLEEGYYQKIVLPDLLIVLLADPEVAVRRKTDEDQGEVRARSTEIWELDWEQTPAVVINANRSKEEVLSDVKEILWSQL